MIHLRNHNNWLRYRVNYELKKKHSDLFEDDWKRIKRSFQNFIIGQNGWWFILLVVGALFSFLPYLTSLPLFNFLNFIQVNPETAEVLVDQRTGNIASIISITLVVVGFLINNLALKEPLSYQLLFKHSFLYPIIYFTLSTIGCFVIVSTLRDWIDPETFIRAVIVGTYFVFIVLFLIGSLFSRIIHFTNPKHIEKLFHKELISEAKENIRLSLTREISREMFKNLMEKNNVKRLSWGDPGFEITFHEPDNEQYIKLANSEKIVEDINLVKLENLLFQTSNRQLKYYTELALETKTNASDNYIRFGNQPRSKVENIILKRSLILKKKPKEEKEKDIVRKYFDQKLEEFTSDNKNKNVASILSSYLELYSLQMKHFLENNQNMTNDVTSGIYENIMRSFNKSISNNSFETFFAIRNFIRKVLSLSIKNNSLEYFQQFIIFPSYYYYFSYNKAKQDISFQEIHNRSFEESYMKLRGLLTIDIPILSKEITLNKKDRNQFYYWVFYGFSKLLYQLLNNQDKNKFEIIVNELSQASIGPYSKDYNLQFQIKSLEKNNEDGNNDEKLKELKEEYKVENQFEVYKRHILSGIKYWIYFLYDKKKIDKQTTEEFANLIRIPHEASNELLDDIDFFRNKIPSYYMGWEDWDYEKRRSGITYSPPRPSHWMVLGIMIDLMRGDRPPILPHDLDNKQLLDVRYLYDDLEKYKDYLQKDFEKWKNIMKVESPEVFEEKSVKILQSIALLKRENISIKEKEIATTPISQLKIDSFKDVVGKGWKNQAPIHGIFKQFGNVENHLYSELRPKTILEPIGSNLFLEKMKMMFIEGNNYQPVYGIQNLGAQIGNNEENRFYNKIIKSTDIEINESSVIEVINSSIEELVKRNKTPSIIIFDPLIRYSYNEILNNEGFQQKNQLLPDEGFNRFYLGEFDKIPVFSSHNKFLRKKILVCDFRKALEMHCITNKDWFEDVLSIKISEVLDKEAKERLNKNPEKWKYADGIELEENDALTLIKTSVWVNISLSVDFEILDRESILLGSVK